MWQKKYINLPVFYMYFFVLGFHWITLKEVESYFMRLTLYVGQTETGITYQFLKSTRGQIHYY